MTSSAEEFRRLHDGPGAFVIPNPWDIGSARILAGMGFKALATTSAGFAHARGLRDGAASREEILAHAREIVRATPLPVSADLENGFFDRPEEVARTIRMAAETGLAGGSIEDSTGRPDQPIYDFALAVERIEAAVEAAKAAPHPFVLTARAENYLHGRPDLDDTLERLAAFAAAGADVLYPPGIRDLEQIRTVCASLPKPVNILMAFPKSAYGVAELAAAGVRRVSLGSGLSRAAYGALYHAAREIRANGTFRFLDEAVPTADIERFMDALSR